MMNKEIELPDNMPYQDIIFWLKKRINEIESAIKGQECDIANMQEGLREMKRLLDYRNKELQKAQSLLKKAKANVYLEEE